jgi:CubicO group peptidase (beta-lactamase class C family)
LPYQCVTWLIPALVLSIPASVAEVAAYVYTAPEKLSDGWETASLSSQSMAAEPLKELIERITRGDYKSIRSVVIIKNNKLVLEEYFPREEGDRRAQAFQRVSPHEQTSATKSVTSLLIGIAIDRGLIRSADSNISTFFPEYVQAFSDARKGEIRLKDLLTMKSGLAWDEWTTPYSDPHNDHIQMLRSEDPIRYVLDRPVVAPPGTKFTYSSGASITLGQIIRSASGMPVDKFAERFLFEPLGVSDFYWAKYPGEIVQTGGGLFLRPRDMAKIGYLFLNGGRWQGKQIVSKKWVDESTKNHVDSAQIPKAAHADGYGYQWWISSLPVGDRNVASYSARGRGGQFTLIVPEERLVIVITSATDDSLTFQPLAMIQQHILPAASANAP